MVPLLQTFEPIFLHKQKGSDGDGVFINNEHDNVYMVCSTTRYRSRACSHAAVTRRHACKYTLCC